MACNIKNKNIRHSARSNYGLHFYLRSWVSVLRKRRCTFSRQNAHNFASKSAWISCQAIDMYLVHRHIMKLRLKRGTWFRLHLTHLGNCETNASSCFVKHGWKLSSSKELLKPMFVAFKFSTLKIKVTDYLKPTDDSVLCFWFLFS